MKHHITIAAAAVAFSLSFEALAVRSSSFGVDAFNAIEKEDSDRTALFSPISFEIDCCVFAEACDPIGRAGIAESMGVLTDLHGVYRPVVDYFSGLHTNGFSFVSARALCLPDISLSYIEFRKRILALCGAAVCRDWPKKGAERYLTVSMEGEMEDFELPGNALGPSHYSYYDLVSIRAALKSPESKGGEVKDRDFICEDGSAVEMPFLSFSSTLDYCKRDPYVVVSIPLDGDALLYLLQPAPGTTMANLRSHFKSAKLADILASVRSVTEPSAGKRVCDISVPLTDVTAEIDLREALQLAHVPSQGFDFINRSLTSRTATQRVRFRLEAPVEPPEGAADDKSPEDAWRAPVQEAVPIIFNSPFIFIVYHPETDAISVLGQFTGR